MPRLTAVQIRDNAERRDRVKQIIANYAKHYGDPNDRHTTLIDLVADLMHAHGHRKSLANARADFADIVRVADGHFVAERKGED